METIIVEIEPGTLIRLPRAEANRLGLKEYTKPTTPEKHKAVKPTKVKKAAEPVQEETEQAEPTDE
jgi:hypothetical protein